MANQVTPRWFSNAETSESFRISSRILGFRTDRKILVFSILSWILIQYLEVWKEMVRTFNQWNPTTYPWAFHTPNSLIQILSVQQFSGNKLAVLHGISGVDTWWGPKQICLTFGCSFHRSPGRGCTCVSERIFNR